jgi:hypothetical protein
MRGWAARQTEPSGRLDGVNHDRVQDVTPADAHAASAAVADFWQGLAEDNDVLILQVTSTGFQDVHGTAAGVSDRIRDDLIVSREDSALMGTSSKVRVVDGKMVFVCVRTDGEPLILASWGPEQREMWRIWTVFERGRWTVGGPYRNADGWPAGTGYLDLPHAYEPDEPIQ